MENWQAAVLAILALVVLKFLVLLIMSGGSVARIWLAARFFYRVLGNPDFAARGAEPADSPAATASAEAFRRSPALADPAPA